MPTDEETRARRGSALDDATEAVVRRARLALADLLHVANTYADENKGAASRRLGDYAQAAHAAAGTLRQREDDLGARVVDEAAERMAAASEAVADASIEGLADGLGQAAKRNPVPFAAGAVLAGLALGYLIKVAASDRGAAGSGSGPPAGHLPGADGPTRPKPDTP